MNDASDPKLPELLQFKGHQSDKEAAIRHELVRLFQETPLPVDHLMNNLGLFIKRKNMSRILFMHHLYEQIIGVHGVIMEFGVRWGQNLALFESFRGMHEPFNHNRKIIGFDTFQGFPSVDEKDGSHQAAQAGYYNVTAGYQDYLEALLRYHEGESPISHMKKFELVKGDATVELGRYLERHPETIVAFAYFDFDIYEPTRVCLEKILPHMTRGSVIGFDELNLDYFPGETVALREVLGLSRYRIRRTPFSSGQSYIVIE